jgi:hypothetical protein
VAKTWLFNKMNTVRCNESLHSRGGSVLIEDEKSESSVVALAFVQWPLLDRRVWDFSMSLPSGLDSGFFLEDSVTLRLFLGFGFGFGAFHVRSWSSGTEPPVSDDNSWILDTEAAKSVVLPVWDFFAGFGVDFLVEDSAAPAFLFRLGALRGSSFSRCLFSLSSR